MKIDIYTLLGLVKDGKAPERILYGNYIWSWFGDDYRTILKDEKEQFLITGMYYAWLTEFLNDEVEIVEEEKKIPEKITMRAGMVGSIYNKLENLDINTMAVEDKINEIIDYLKNKGE